MLKIGKIAPPSEKEAVANHVLAILKSKQVSAQIVSFPSAADAYIALQSADIQMIAKPLAALKNPLPTGIVITALSERAKAGSILYIHPTAVGTGGGLSLKKGVRIRVHTLLEQVQLAAFDTDWQIVLSGDADAYLETENKDSKYDGFESFYLNPKELIPIAGQGAIAYLSRKDDIPTRKMLQTIHHADVSACTNIERTVQKLFFQKEPNQPIGAYCERDAQANFHLWVCDWTGKTVRVSQNTHFGLAEAAFQQF